MFTLEVQLDGNPIPMELCRCLSADAVAAVVLALCRAQGTRPVTIRRLYDDIPPETEAAPLLPPPPF